MSMKKTLSFLQYDQKIRQIIQKEVFGQILAGVNQEMVLDKGIR